MRNGEELEAVRPDYNLDEFGRSTRKIRKAYVPYLVDHGAPDDDVLRDPVTVRPRESG